MTTPTPARPAASGPDLTTLIDNTYTVQMLRDLARNAGWVLRGTRKEDLIAQAIEYHQQSTNWAQRLQNLAPEQRCLLQTHFLAAGLVQPTPLAALQDMARACGFKSPDIQRILADLCTRVESVLFAGQWVHLWPGIDRHIALDQTWCRPLPALEHRDQVRLADPAALVLAAQGLAPYLDQARWTVPPQQRAYWGDAHATWLGQMVEYSGYGPRLRRREPLLGDKASQDMAAALALAPRQVNLLMAALLDLGATTVQGDGRLALSPGSADLLEGGEPFVLARRLVQAALNSVFWYELDTFFPDPPLFISAYSGSNPLWSADQADLPLRSWRLIARRALALLSPHAWYPLPGLIDALHRGYEVIASRMGQTSLYLSEPRGSSVKSTTLADFRASHGRLYTYLLSGPFHELGLTDLALRKGQVVVVRPSALCRYLIELDAQPPVGSETAAAGRITFLDTLTLQVQESSPGLRLLLAQVASPDWSQGRQRGGVRRYRLDIERVCAALQRGVTLPHLLEQLSVAAGGSLPDQTQQRLQAWATTFGRRRVHTGVTVIEFADDLALPELLRSTDLARIIRRQLSPRHVVIERAEAAAFFQQLIQRGYTPTPQDD